MGKVKWTGDDPFCLGGDSGALIYTVLRGVKLPIGIHKGSRPGVSVCWLLGGIFDVIELLYDETDFFCCSSDYHA
jgi:hypothetical protein